MLHHAVQELLHTTGGTDYYLETGDKGIWRATERLYRNMLKKLYITGTVGSISRGALPESAGKDFQLTNEGAYAETCAAISNVFWQWRMFLATGRSQHIDMLERALYNGVQVGIADNGHEYFYVNPHEHRAVDPEGSITLDKEDGTNSWHKWPEARKEEWPCSCCPPNVHRLFASMQQYIYATDNDQIWVNLFIDSEFRHQLDDGSKLEIHQRTGYPWEEKTQLEVFPSSSSTQLSLKLRIPDWCRNASISVNGATIDTPVGEDGYVTIQREWKNGDTVELTLPMPVRLVGSHPKNIANYGKAVIMRGPLVYCLEQVDNPDVDIFGMVLSRQQPNWQAAYEEDWQGGLVTIQGQAWFRDDTEWDKQPYQDLDQASTPTMTPVTIKAIPFSAWANRGKSSMVTALPYI